MSLALYESSERVAVIRITRPAKRNAINTQLASELQAAWTRFEAGEDRVAVITGYAPLADGCYPRSRGVFF